MTEMHNPHSLDDYGAKECFILKVRHPTSVFLLNLTQHCLEQRGLKQCAAPTHACY